MIDRRIKPLQRFYIKFLICVCIIMLLNFKLINSYVWI